MRKFSLYDPSKTYVFPNGRIATPEAVATEYPAMAVYPYIIETDLTEQMFLGSQNLADARSRNGIDPALTDEQAVAALEAIANVPLAEPQEFPTATERIAAALEYQNLLTM